MTEETPMDDAEFDDLDQEEAFQVGLLAELSAIRQELQGIREALQDEHPADEHSTDDRTTVYRCSSCGDRHWDEAAAKSHAVGTHGAPSTGDAWRASVEVIET